MAGKRSKAAIAGLTGKKPKRITGKQRAARKVNIEVARRARKSSGGKKANNAKFAKTYKSSRKIGLTKAQSLLEAGMMTGGRSKTMDVARRMKSKQSKTKFSDIQPYRG